LVEGAPGEAIYRWSEGKEPEVVSVLPNGDPTSAFVGDDKSTPPMRTVSADGSRVYFNSGSDGAVYLHEDGQPTKAISVSHIPSDDPTVAHQARLLGVSKDGRYAFFFSVEGKLTSDAPDENPSRQGDVYRYDASDGSLEYLGAAAAHGALSDDVTSPVGVSDDGETVYFRSPDHTLVWRDGVIKQAASSPLRINGGTVAMSTSGRYLAYEEGGNVSAGGNIYGNVVLYDAETDQLSCASCLPDGSPGSGYLPGGERFTSNRVPQAVTNAGQAFFTSSARLVAADVNGNKDAYMFQNGKASLISPGNGNYDAIFADISEDGSDVFFTTNQKLVGQDNDDYPDLYDARIGGGLAKQNPPPPQECLRDDCKATPNAGPELPFGGSEALSGTENVKGEARKRCGKGAHARKVKGKTRCVKQSKAKKAKHAKKASTNRRQGR
jgi:hypothetical protein